MRERLKHLDVIGLGRKIDLVFLLRAPEEAAAAERARQGIVDASLVAEGEGLAPHRRSRAGEMTLGRAASNNVVAESSSVSKVHARIERIGGPARAGGPGLRQRHLRQRRARS